ncbi:MAG: HDOD domain-containing protein [Verrucomicrobiota bacterium]
MNLDLDTLIKSLEEAPLATSIIALNKARVALASLNDPNSVTVETIEKELIKISPELYAFIFKQAKIKETENIQEGLDEAIATLGFNRVKKLIYFHIAFSGELDEDSTDLDRLFAARLWSLNYAIASTAEFWVSRLHPSLAEEAFFLGMFQNIGISAFAQLQPSRHRALRESNRKIPLHQKEEEHYGFNHYDLAIALTQSWALPTTHIAALRYEISHGQIIPISIGENHEDLLQILYYSKFRCENKKQSKGAKELKYGIDPYFEYDNTLLQIVAERIAELKPKKAS